MNYFMKVARRMRLAAKSYAMRSDQEMLAIIKKGVKRVEKEETPACEHATLRQLITKDMWYQCHQCKAVLFIHGVHGWTPKQIPHLHKALAKSLTRAQQVQLSEKTPLDLADVMPELDDE